jgi:CelD/BcsL family acetyltransferase involved in cellulose biosynthesis
LAGVEELDALAGRWRALDEWAATPAQRLAWIRACASGFGGELEIVVAEQGDQLLAVAPMVVREEGALELVGARELNEPADFAYRDEAALDHLVRELLALRTGIVLPRLATTSPTLNALRRAYRGRGAVLVRAAGSTPVLDLVGDPEASFSGRRRSDLRRAARRAGEMGAVSTEILSPSPAELGGLMAELFAVEAAGWKGARGTALAHDEVRRRFFDEYAAATAAEGTLRLCFLRIGGEAAAVQLAVEHARRLWLLKIGYDERFARCSPGTLLLLETARWAKANRLTAIELLGERDDWTRSWTDEKRDCVAVRVYPATARGMRSLVGDAAGHARRRVTRRVVARAERAHVAGPELADAVTAAQKVNGAVALAFWDGPEDTPAKVESSSLSALDAIAEHGLDGYVSVKPAALGFARERLERVLARAGELGLVVHFDSTGPEDAEPSWALLAELARPGLGCTLPSSWRRSLADAERAVELGVRARIVKGQWPEAGVDERAGFLALADALAGRAAHVAVATHDRRLAEEAIGRLAGTSVEHELMLGLPRRGASGVRARVYVPFGHAYLPYAPGRARRSGRVAGWVARDLLRG